MKKRASASLEEELELPPGLEPTVLDNLRESQKECAKRGLNLTLLQVYNLEYDEVARANHLEQSGQPQDSPFPMSWPELRQQAGASLLQNGLAETQEEGEKMVEKGWA